MLEVEDRYKWYVVRAISGQEKKVKQYIQVELERENKTEFVPGILIPHGKGLSG